MERDQRPAGKDKVGAATVLPQRHNRKETDEADDDKGRFNDTKGDIANGDGFALPPEDAIQHDGRGDIGDGGEDLQERSELDPRVGPSADDVVGVVQNRGVEEKRCWYREDKGKDEPHSRNQRGSSVWVHRQSPFMKAPKTRRLPTPRVALPMLVQRHAPDISHLLQSVGRADPSTGWSTWPCVRLHVHHGTEFIPAPPNACARLRHFDASQGLRAWGLTCTNAVVSVGRTTDLRHLQTTNSVAMRSVVWSAATDRGSRAGRLTFVKANRNAPVYSHGQIEIAASPEAVWNLMADIESWPNWNSDVKEVTLQGEIVEGTPFRWKAGPGTITSVLRIVDRPNALGWTGRTFGIDAIHVWRFVPLGEQNIASMEEAFDGLVARLFRSRLQKQLDATTEAGLETLKATAERRQRA